MKHLVVTPHSVQVAPLGNRSKFTRSGTSEGHDDVSTTQLEIGKEVLQKKLKTKLAGVSSVPFIGKRVSQFACRTEI